MKKIIAISLSLMIFLGGTIAAQPVEDTSKKEDVPTLGDTFNKGLIQKCWQDRFHPLGWNMNCQTN